MGSEGFCAYPHCSTISNLKVEDGVGEKILGRKLKGVRSDCYSLQVSLEKEFDRVLYLGYLVSKNV